LWGFAKPSIPNASGVSVHILLKTNIESSPNPLKGIPIGISQTKIKT